jgi:hypothetical protein
MSEYFVNQNDIREMSRLLKQSWYFIKQFGGWLAERPDFRGIHRVLDVACGPGE